MKKILFVSHSAGRTGAPIMLLNMLRWFKHNTEISFEILLREAGELISDFEALAPTRVFSPPSINKRQGALARILNVFSLKTDQSETKYLNQLLNYYHTSGFSLIYSNTITNGELLNSLSPLQIPVVTHVHELKYWIDKSGSKNINFVKQFTNRYIVASNSVKDNLIVNVGLHAKDIDVVHSFIPKINSLPTPENCQELRLALNISKDSFVVVGSGYETWRKGKDLFILLAAELIRRGISRSVHFIWVGGWCNDEHQRNIHHDVVQLGLDSRVHFVGAVSNPYDYFSVGDVFVMVSREDPYPLVCLEAAALGKPILCFEGAGGTPEFVENDCGFIVPYLDLGAMVERLMLLSKDAKLLSQLGENAQKKVFDRHNVAVGCGKVLEILERF